MIDYEFLITKTCETAPFPVTAVRLAQLLSDPDYNTCDVIDVIRYDQVLTARVLRAANSAANASYDRVATVGEAVFRIGSGQILALAVAAGVRPLFNQKIMGYGVTEANLWRHSMAAAVAVETAQAFCNVPIPPPTFTAALLHDIGKLAIGRFLPNEQLTALNRARDEEGLTPLEAEKKVLGLDHGQLGGLIAKRWQLPARIVHAITYHHFPLEGDDLICDFVYFANQLAKQIERGLDGSGFDFVEVYEEKLSYLPTAVRRIGMTGLGLNELCPVAEAQYKKISQRYNATFN